MSKKLFLTPSELNEILTDCYEPRFKIIKENIPTEFQFDEWEKNNRRYLGVYFQDTETNSFYYIECSRHNTYGFEFDDYSYSSENGILTELPSSIIQLDNNIKLVKNSVIDPITIQPDPIKKEIVPEKTEYQLLVEEYRKIELIKFEDGLNNITFAEMKSLREMTTELGAVSINEMFTRLLKIAIPNKINVDKLKNFVYSKKKHVGSKSEQIKTKQNMIKKLQREIIQLEK